MNITLWIIASLLALAFLASGGLKILRSRPQVIGHGYSWAEDFSPIQVKLIGVAEILGAIGLIVPAATGTLNVLTPSAALGLTLLMIGGVIVHLRRGEITNLAAPIVLGILAAAVAVLRAGPFSF